MVKGKVQMKKIENATSRQVTFCKRRSGFLKKAYELCVLCDAQVAAIIFSQNGRLYDFSSSDMTKILERYREYTKDVPAKKYGHNIQQLKLDSTNMAKKIELLEHSKRKLLAQNVSSCSYDELVGIEEQLQRSLQRVRERKSQLYTEQIDKLQSQWQRLEKSSQQQWPRDTQAETAPPRYCSSSQGLDVDTELFIGLPKQQC